MKKEWMILKRFLGQQVTFSSFRQNVMKGFVIGSCVAILLIFFQPFGTYSAEFDWKYLMLAGYGGVIFIGYTLYYGILSKVFSYYEKAGTWSFWQDQLAFWAGMLFISLLAMVYHHAFFGLPFSVYSFVSFTYYGLVLSFFPWLLLVSRKVNRMHAAANTRSSIQNEVGLTKGKLIILEGTNQDETLECSEDTLLFMRASGNYVEAYVQKEEHVEMHMLRNTLSNLTEQAGSELLQKTHRSFVVNMRHIKSIEGKSPNYLLKFSDPDLEVPVSRSFLKEVRHRYQQKN